MSRIEQLWTNATYFPAKNQPDSLMGKQCRLTNDKSPCLIKNVFVDEDDHGECVLMVITLPHGLVCRAKLEEVEWLNTSQQAFEEMMKPKIKKNVVLHTGDVPKSFFDA